MWRVALLRLKQKSLWAALLPWFVAAVTILGLKLHVLIAEGFRDSAICLRHSGSLSIGEKLSLLHSDLVGCFLLIPLLLGALLLLLPTRWRLPVSAFVAIVLQVLVNVQVAAYDTTGAFLSFGLMRVSVLWAFSHHDSVAFFPSKYAYWTEGLAVLTLAFVVLAGIALRKGERWKWVGNMSFAVFAFGAAMAVITFVPREPGMPWTPSLLRQAAHATLFENGSQMEAISGGPAELLRMYQETSLSPDAQSSAYSGKAKGYNVLFFVMESMSAHAFDPAQDSLQDMPNMRKLRENSFVMKRHYTTYPLTNYVVFSIFTSMYATCSPGSELRDDDVQVPSIIRTLKGAGYDTGYYGFVWKDPEQQDDKLLTSIGFQKLVEPDIDTKVIDDGMELFSGSVDVTANFDYQALQLLRKDIHVWGTKRQRFAAAYFPELSHDPYREFEGHPFKTPIERGHALAVRQDAWMGEILEDLKREGLMDNTIIVVTGDHGMRWFPQPKGNFWEPVSKGKLEDVTLRVPMMIYVPKVLKHTVKVDYPTSHIDIAPTLRDLLGLSKDSEFEEGTSIFNRQIVNRRLFLFSNLFGASGYFYGGNYYMRSRSNITYKSPLLSFADENVMPYDGKDSADMRNVLNEQESLQRGILSHVLGQRVPFFSKMLPGI